MIPPKQIKAVIFDLDGTLINSIPFHEESFFELFKSFGHTLPRKRIRKQLRLPTEEIYEKLGARKKLDVELEKFLHLRRHFYYRLIRAKPLVFNDVYLTLSRLRTVKRALATNSSRETLLRSTPAKLFNRFKYTISFSESTRAKPNPEMLLTLSRKMRVKPSQCLVIGDSIMDMRAAKSAGMITAGLYRKTGASTLRELSREKPDYLIRSLRQIPKIVSAQTTPRGS